MNSLPSPFDNISMSADVTDLARAAVAFARSPAQLEKLSKPELIALMERFELIRARLLQEVARKERLLAQQSEDT
jgi:hypothetical protein